MQETLFNPALWLPTAAFAIAIAVAIYGNNRTDAKVRNVGIGLLIAALAWSGIAYFVQTPLEKCLARTDAILDAAETANWPELRALLDDRTTIAIGTRSIRGREDIAQTAETAAVTYGLTAIRRLGTETTTGIGSIDVTFRALLEGSGTLPSDWRFEYEVGREGITLTRIVPIRIGMLSSDQLADRAH